MNPFRWSFRAQFLAGFLGCVALIGYAIYTQLYQGLKLNLPETDKTGWDTVNLPIPIRHCQ